MISSKTIRMRFVEISDAEFILSLRLDNKFNKFLSQVDADLESQKRWISNYKEDELNKKQYYFIIERLDGTPCGTVRIYDLRKDSFCWGSWILNKDKTRYSAIESALMVYDFGFNVLNYKSCHFDVMKGNEKVIKFHEKFGAIEISQDKENFYFTIDRNAVNETKKRFVELL